MARFVLNLRRLAMGLCALVLAAALLPSMAHAAQDDRTFTQSFTVSAETLHVGEPFTLNLVLTCDNYDEYLMYSYSTTFRVNTDLFQVVDYSASKLLNRFDINEYAETDSRGSWTRFVVNGMGDLSGTTWGKETTVATLTLLPKALGSTAAEITRVNVSNETGMRQMPCATSNLPLTVAIPARLVGQPLTAASGLVLMPYELPVPQGSVPTFKDQPFVWDGQRFVTLVTAANFEAATGADFDMHAGSAVGFLPGDTNSSGQLSIIDAQIAYDAARGVYANLSALSVRSWLACDTNCDGVVEAADARAIQVALLTAA